MHAPDPALPDGHFDEPSLPRRVAKQRRHCESKDPQLETKLAVSS